MSTKYSFFCDTRLKPAQDISADRVFEPEVSFHTKRCKRPRIKVNATDVLEVKLGDTACFNSFRVCVCVCVCVRVCVRVCVCVMYVYVYVCVCVCVYIYIYIN